MKKIVVIFIIVLSFLGCQKEPLTTQKKKEAEKEIQKAKAEISSKNETISESESLSSAIQKPELFAEYKIISYKYMDAKSLYEKIDGQADGYVENHGFVGCGYLELKHKVKETPVFVYVYDMDKPIQAFGIYSSERKPEYLFNNIGNEGYFDDKKQKRLTFWKGKYCIKIEIQQELAPEQSKELLLDIANLFIPRINDDGNTLNQFNVFPKENRLEKGEQFIKANFASQDFFKNIYLVQYQGGDVDNPPQAFLTLVKDQAEAKEIVKKYQVSLMSGKNSGIKSLKVLKNGFSGVDPIDGNKLVIYGTNYIVGVSGFKTAEKNLEMANLIQNNIK